MRFFERSVSRAVLGACAPVALMLAGWWGSLALLGDSPWIPWAALIGRRRAAPRTAFSRSGVVRRDWARRSGVYLHACHGELGCRVRA